MPLALSHSLSPAVVGSVDTVKPPYPYLVFVLRHNNTTNNMSGQDDTYPPRGLAAACTAGSSATEIDGARHDKRAIAIHLRARSLRMRHPQKSTKTCARCFFFVYLARGSEFTSMRSINITVATVVAGQVKPIRTTVEQPSLADSSPRIHNHFLTLYCCMYAH